MTEQTCGTCLRATPAGERCRRHPDAELYDPTDPRDGLMLTNLRQLRSARRHTYRQLSAGLLMLTALVAFCAGMGPLSVPVFAAALAMGAIRPRLPTPTEPAALLPATAEPVADDNAARAQRRRNQARRGPRHGSGRFLDGITNQ